MGKQGWDKSIYQRIVSNSENLETRVHQKESGELYSVFASLDYYLALTEL